MSDTPVINLPTLATHRHQVRTGEALPFGICDAEGRLPLARGRMIDSIAQFDGLLERGAYIVRDLAAEAAERVAEAKASQLPALWTESADQVDRLLRAKVDPQYHLNVVIVAQPVLALVQRDPDLAISHVVRSDDGVLQHDASRRPARSNARPSTTTHLAVPNCWKPVAWTSPTAAATRTAGSGV